MKVGERIFGNRLIRHAENGNTDACQRVLTKRNISVSAKVNAKHRQTGNTALHQACLNGHVITAKLLLEKGAKINANNKKGETPLMCACRNRHVEIATLLLTQYYDKNEVGAHINERNNAGWTALHYASSFLSRSKKDNTCIDMCFLLLRHGALINGTANNGNTPLHFAAHKGHARLVKALMDRGANIEAVNKAGKTPVESANHGCKPQDLLDYHDALVQKKDLEKRLQQQADAKDKSMSKSVATSSSLMKKEPTSTATADSTGSAAAADAIVQQHQQLHVEQEITMSQVKANMEKMTTLMETLEQQSRQEQQLALALQRQVTALQDQIRAMEVEKVEMMEESVHLLEETVELRQQVAKLQDLPRQKMDSLQLQKSKLMLIKNKQDQNQEPSSSATATAEQPQPQQDATEASEDPTENHDEDVAAPAAVADDSIVKAAEESSKQRSLPSSPSRRLSKSKDGNNNSNNKSVRMSSPKHGII